MAYTTEQMAKVAKAYEDVVWNERCLYGSNTYHQEDAKKQTPIAIKRFRQITPKKVQDLLFSRRRLCKLEKMCGD